MKPISTFTVVPALPLPLERLRDLAANLRWVWHHDTIALFQRLDSDLWETSGHNPVLMLGTIEQAKLEAAAADASFLEHLARSARHLDTYLDAESTWFAHAAANDDIAASSSPLIAYFSAEFGLTECLSIFAGGLGMLAGDHLKSASDLGLPLVGVGLLYQQGYFQQRLNEAGWQQENYLENDFHNLPLLLEHRPDGTPLTVAVAYPNRQVLAQVWRAQVGRVPLYLLDTNIPANRPEDRDITDQLYGGDLEMRIKQEMLLGLGGCRALEALGVAPGVYHMNEGHSAFLSLERIRRIMEMDGRSFAEARELAAASLVFTTHTPVPAGHDYFSADLMDRYFVDYWRSLGLTRHDFLALGRRDPSDENEAFCMTILALRLAQSSNAVSRLHGQVSRQMWQGLWAGVPEDEIPIEYVTNGVHFRSWVSGEMDQLYERYLGPRWRDETADQSLWQGVERIPDAELWRTHERRRERLVSFARRRLRMQLGQRGASQAEIEAAGEVLDPEILTIGFARRFATYKRATLLLRDPERLARLLNHPERPMQIIFAGKAHPRDKAGKELIQQIVTLARQEPFRNRLVFLEDYDMSVARYLVQGADVWLNTPRRPREASGTSGMKATANGVLNLSIPDGWWDEAYQPHVGWAIGKGETYDDLDYQDEVEAAALYALLERDVAPIFYEQGHDGLPRRWLAFMKANMSQLCAEFNAHRMVQAYTTRFYLPAAARYRQLAADNGLRASQLAAWKARIQENWPSVRVESVDAGQPNTLHVGEEIQTHARVSLGSLTVDDVAVELFLGRVNASGILVDASTTPMLPVKSNGNGVFLFEVTAVPCRLSGRHGYTVRVLPHHTDLKTPFLPGLVAWA